MPPGSAGVRRSIEPRTPPSGSYRSWRAFADALLAGRQPRLQADGAFCPRPLSAAPRASRALGHVLPVKGARGWTSETRLSSLASGPASFEASRLFWSSSPHRSCSQAQAPGGCWLIRPSSLAALRALRPGRDPPSPEGPSSRSRRPFALRTELAPSPSLEISFVSVVEFRTASFRT